MIRKFLYINVFLILFASCAEEDNPAPKYIKSGDYTGEYFPTTAWRECAPEEVGINSKKLKAVYDYCADHSRNTFSFLIVKDGYIVAEDYFGIYSADQKIESYSLAKSFTAALTGVAIQNGYIDGLEDQLIDYFPDFGIEESDSLKKEINIRHLLSMTAGFQ